MKHINTSISLAVLLITTSAGTHAASPYAGVSFGHFQHENPGLPSLNNTSMVLHGGFKFNKYLSIEGRAGLSTVNNKASYNISTTSNTTTGAGTETAVTTSTFDRSESNLDSLYGIYLKGQLPVTNNANIFALAGYSDSESTVETHTGNVLETTEVTDTTTGEVSSSTSFVSGPGSSRKVSANGFSYGVGMNYRFEKDVTISLEYTSYLEESEYDLTAFSVGLTWDF